MENTCEKEMASSSGAKKRRGKGKKVGKLAKTTRINPVYDSTELKTKLGAAFRQSEHVVEHIQGKINNTVPPIAVPHAHGIESTQQTGDTMLANYDQEVGAWVHI